MTTQTITYKGLRLPDAIYQDAVTGQFMSDYIDNMKTVGDHLEIASDTGNNTVTGTESTALASRYSTVSGSWCLMAGSQFTSCNQDRCIVTGDGKSEYNDTPNYTGIKNFTTLNLGENNTSILKLASTCYATITADVMVAALYTTAADYEHVVMRWDGHTLLNMDGTSPSHFGVSNGELYYCNSNRYGYGGTIGLRFTVLGSFISVYSLYNN